MELEGPSLCQKIHATCNFTMQYFHNFLNFCLSLLVGGVDWFLRWMRGPVKEARRDLAKLPGPQPWPFFGTTGDKDLNFAKLTQNSEKLLKQYGPLIKCEWYWNVPLILAYDPDDIDFIVKNASTIRPPIEIVKTYRQTRKDRYFSVGIVNVQNEEWHVFRPLLLSTLRNTKYITNCVSDCDEIATDFIKVLHGFVGVEIGDFEAKLVRFNAESAFHNVLGKRMGLLALNTPNKLDLFITSQEKYFRALHNGNYGFPHWKYWRNGTWDDLKKCEDSTYDIFKSVVEEEVLAGPQGLLKLILEANEIHELDKIVLAMDLVLGAIEPVLNSLIFCIDFIAANPEVQEKLYQHLKDVLPEKDSTLDEVNIKDLTYLDACIKEAFRLLPTTPNLARLVDREIQLRGYRIPAYTLFLCQHWHANLQNENFYRAKEFIPERWLFNGESRTKEFLPHRKNLYHFGLGKRECPGRRFALMEMTTVLAKVFRNFKVELIGRVQTRFEFLVVPETPINVVLTNRPD